VRVFHSVFDDRWQREKEEIVRCYPHARQWTTYMLGSGRVRTSAMLFEVAQRLGYRDDEIRFETYRTDLMLWSCGSSLAEALQSGRWAIDLHLEVETDIRKLAMVVRTLFDFTSLIRGALFYAKDPEQHLDQIKTLIAAMHVKQDPPAQLVFIFGRPSTKEGLPPPDTLWRAFVFDQQAGQFSERSTRVP
jgi:hypothetical protein